jgi:hypothetical protein
MTVVPKHPYESGSIVPRNAHHFSSLTPLFHAYQILGLLPGLKVPSRFARIHMSGPVRTLRTTLWPRRSRLYP